MNSLFKRLSQSLRVLSWPLQPFRDMVSVEAPGHLREDHLKKTSFPLRMIRYWLAGQAISREAKKQGRPLVVVDLGCERGWLQWFVPKDAVSRWIGMDWNPKIKYLSNYDQIVDANFDVTFPLEKEVADVVVSLHVFEHLPRPGYTMAEVSRILKPNGIFFGGAPTMPGWIASWREKFFRKQLAEGAITPGGHINSLAPGRWSRLAYEVGLRSEFLVGTHAIRMSGTPLESQRWWVRLNLFWGALFPALGSDCYIQARREDAWVDETAPLRRRPKKWRGFLIAASVLLLAGLVALPFYIGHAGQSATAQIHQWIENEQDGNDVFLLTGTWVDQTLLDRKDVVSIESNQLGERLQNAELDAHVIISRETLLSWLASELPTGSLSVVSQLALRNRDFYLLEKGELGIPVEEFFATNLQ